MRRDKNAPALLELIAKGRAPVTARPVVGSAQAPATMAGPSAAHVRPVATAPMPAPAPRVPEPPPAAALMPEDTAVSSWLSPGRAIRVPTGYVVPLALLIVVLVVGAYATGYRSRKSEELTQKSDSAAQEMDALVDPLNQQAAAPPPTRAAPKPAGQSTKPPPPKATTPPKTSEAKANPGVPGRSAGVVIVTGPGDDPRQSGLNYLIAATLPLDEAEKAAAFLVSRGLEIAVVPADNRSLRWVVVLQGTAAKDLSGPSAKTLEQRLQTLGREYKQVLKGPTVFNDPWWKKHTK